MATNIESAPARVVSARVPTRQRVAEIWKCRELLTAMVRKELKVKYKDSAIGFAWSMLNPAMYLVIYYLVFSIFLRNGIPLFPIWLLSGLLVWNFFSGALSAATGSVVGNSALVKKVSFPREILPLASVGASLVHFCLQSLVLLASLALFRHGVDPAFIFLVPGTLLVLVALASALGLLLAATNVYVRDLQHLLELVLAAWFWLTPIIYPFRQIGERLQAHGIPSWVFLLNPLTPIVVTFQRAIYNDTTVLNTVDKTPIRMLYPTSVIEQIGLLAIVLVLALGVLWIAMRVFQRLEGNFAEEL
jgi:ABC-2 type transport system permease protein